MRNTNLFPWRPPLPPDWNERWTAVNNTVRNLKDSAADAGAFDAICTSARQLASRQLGAAEQLKLERLARGMLAVANRHEAVRCFRLGLIGNHTLGFLIDPLRAAGLSRGIFIDAEQAQYDSIARFAFGETEVFASRALDAVVVILDIHAFAFSQKLLDRAEEDRVLAKANDLLNRVATTARKKLGVPAIVATIIAPEPPLSSADIATPGTATRFMSRVNAAIAKGGEDGDWIVWDLAALAAKIGHDHWFDAVRFHEVKAPFRIELCPLVADNLSRIIAALTGKSARALVFDLDNTIWGGVIGDDGPTGLRLGHGSPEGEAYSAFQRFLLGVRDRGIVLAVCSKNDDEIAREPFRTRPDMLLREKDIAVFQANWQDKAANIEAIAGKLNLGLDSLVFVDDNPAERERIRQALPLVAVPEVGDNPAHFPARITDAGSFEHLVLNLDDLTRAKSYEGVAARAELQANAANYDEYLRSLRMTLVVSPFDSMGAPRIAQLVNKSNQFNLTTRRYNEDDIRNFAAKKDFLCWQAKLIDVFGPQGMIAVVIVRRGRHNWTIDTWLQSCRVLARGVEESLMNLLVDEARRAGAGQIIGEYVPTGRNRLVADFFPRLGFQPSGLNSNVFSCSVRRFDPLKSFIDVDSAEAGTSANEIPLDSN